MGAVVLRIRNCLYIVGVAWLGCFLVSSLTEATAAVQVIDGRIIEDSPEPISERIYSYDMTIDGSGTVHIVYSRPTTGAADDIVYLRKVGGQWKPEVILSNDGLRGSISTKMQAVGNNTVHVCYLKESTGHLYHRKVVNGASGQESYVDRGSWNTVIQLDDDGMPLFVRETEESGVSRLALLATSNGYAWDRSLLNLPQAKKFRIADFLFRQGQYHITYGDGEYARPALAGKASTAYIDVEFHDFWYATSANAVDWDVSAVDRSGTLKELEFWTTLALDNETPIVGMYRYAEYNEQFNTGTSALLVVKTEDSWAKASTGASYPETREGMGLAVLVRKTGEYLGVWDFSPDNTQNAYFRGQRGNIAIARNGRQNDWADKVQLDPFSAEGRIVLKRHRDRLYILFLGDYVDSKLFYREVRLSDVDAEFDRVYSGFNWPIFLPAIQGAR